MAPSRTPTWTKSSVSNYRMRVDIVLTFLREKYGTHHTDEAYNVKSGKSSITFNAPCAEFTKEDTKELLKRKMSDKPSNPFD